MGDLVINPATENERDWTAELLAGTEPWISLGLTRDQCQKNCHDPEYLLYIAHRDGKPCGALLMQRRGVAGSPYIKSLAVSSDYRSQGVGETLMKFAEELFRAEAKHLFLCVSSFNHRARAFYERLGYRAVGEFPDYVVDGASEILMHKLGYALFQAPAGALADRWGARTVLLIAAWLWAGITIIQAVIGWGPFQTTLISALSAFMVSRFLLGISAAPAYPAAGQGVARWLPARQQGRANGIVLASIGLGSALAPPLVSNVMIHWGWRIALIVSALPALVIALLWHIVPAPETTPQPTEQNASALASAGKSSLKTREFVLLTLS